MLSTTLLRRSSKALANKDIQLRLFSALPFPDKKNGREMHSSTANRSSVDAIASPLIKEQAQQEEATKTFSLQDRFIVTAEVTVSKIFPAGFGWQTASVVATTAGLDSVNFALATGLGDAIGVLCGHVAYYTAKKAALQDSTINMTQEYHTGILLASAAMCSGTAWQPLVSTLQGANLSFNEVFVGTWVGCGLAFYTGLRVGRTLLHGALSHIEEPTYENSKSDVGLSTSIGGATAFFVGTDIAYLPHQNFLIDIVGITNGTPDMMGAAIAGSSTALGFMTTQGYMNMIYPKDKCWLD
jgi:hypothetical protein